MVTRLLTGSAWLFALLTIWTLVAGELSNDPEYYVPTITALIAATCVLLAGHRRRTASKAPHR